MSSREFFLSEEDLVTALKNHNARALEILYDMYKKPIFDIIAMMIKEDPSEQVLHEVFGKIWNSIHEYDSCKYRLFTWMFNLARNHAMDVFRHKSHQMNSLHN